MNESAGYASILDPLGYVDDQRPLPFVQLGDLFYKDASSLLFAVLNASCDLQYVPEHLWQSRGISRSQARIRKRTESILLVPGSARPIDAQPLSRLNTGLIRLQGEWHSVDWFPKEMVSIPHCALRSVFEDQGFQHSLRLQMSRAIELQQNCFSQLSRVGLEVQPALHSEYRVKMYANNAGVLTDISSDLAIEAVAFHSGKTNVAVLKYDSLTEMRTRIAEREELKEALKVLNTEFYGLHKTPFSIPETVEVAQLNLIEDNKKRKLLKFGTSKGDPPSTSSVNKKYAIVLSFIDKLGAECEAN